MAITFEEEKKKINWFALAIIIIIVATSVTAVYYLFFVNPPLIEIVIPFPLKSLEQMSQIKINPMEVFDNPILKNLSQYVEPIIVLPSESILNSNPFK
ncbi:MAG: hypothetical protein AAB496_02050 [Patescibacteria group bacterium]